MSFERKLTYAIDARGQITIFLEFEDDGTVKARVVALDRIEVTWKIDAAEKSLQFSTEHLGKDAICITQCLGIVIGKAAGMFAQKQGLEGNRGLSERQSGWSPVGCCGVHS
jgi:hypothetical protein